MNPDDETTAKAECDKIQASLSSKYGEPVERDKAQHQYSPAGIVSYKDNFYDYQRIGSVSYTHLTLPTTSRV